MSLYSLVLTRGWVAQSFTPSVEQFLEIDIWHWIEMNIVTGINFWASCVVLSLTIKVSNHECYELYYLCWNWNGYENIFLRFIAYLWLRNNDENKIRGSLWGYIILWDGVMSWCLTNYHDKSFTTLWKCCGLYGWIICGLDN